MGTFWLLSTAVEMSDPIQGAAPMIVLEGGRLTLCELGGSSERQLDLGECLEMCDANPLPLQVAPAQDASPKLWPDGPTRRIEPGAPCVTLAGGGGLHTYSDSAARWYALGETHIRVVAAMWHRSTIPEVAERAGLGVEDVQAVLDDLLMIGVVRRTADQDSVPAERDAPTPAVVADQRPPREADRQPSDQSRSPRIPVYSFWATHSGPHLGSAAVVAYARVCNDRALTGHYDLHRTAPASLVLEEIRTNRGPSILLCSNYIWSLEANLDVARAAIAANPRVVVVHGGPSTPRYPAEGERFLRDLDGTHVLVNGEGELTFAELLGTIAARTPDAATELDLSGLDAVAGIQFLDPHSGTVVRTESRERHDHLADFPSAVVSGELDDVDIEVLRKVPLSIETNRGCPYSCTFCDWGQNTMSRIRKFPLERVRSELAWLAEHGIEQWILADANFGIFPRDLDITDMIASVRTETGFPEWILVAPPKNATSRFVDIIDRLLDSGVSMKAALALQTRDNSTLDAIERSNIGTESYDRLAVELRNRGLPLTSDLMMGLPGATVDSFMADLQWSIDNQVRAYLWPTFVLPNSPMNDPEYRQRHRIRTTGDLVVETATYSAEQRHLMDRYAYGYQVLEVLGVMRHLLRFLQWDHGVCATDTIRDVVDLSDAHPERFPLLNWLLNHTDVFLTAPVGWSPLFSELQELLVRELGIPDRADLHTVLKVNEFILPSPNRSVPEAMPLVHDYGAYFHSAQSRLLAQGPAQPSAPLVSFGPGSIEVLADPDEICVTGLRRLAEGRVPAGYVGDFSVVAHIELLTTVATYLPFTSDFLNEARARGAGSRVPITTATDGLRSRHEPAAGTNTRT